ncbi:MAG TPA: protein kinase [Gemmataceae bacterium]|nr:protein kinase [Gemmataceae bacterium]
MKIKRDMPFHECLKSSKLLSKEQLAEACAAVGEEEPYLSRHLVQQGLLTRFQARQLREGSNGFFIDKYVVVDYLGRGGNSIVYKARHTLLPNRFVALKTLDVRNLHHSEDALARFRTEVEIVSRLDHANVVRAFDVIQKRSQLYLVLEFVDGCDLGKLVGQLGPLPIAEAVGYIVQAAHGLGYAHRCGIVHRDVKPANLLLARDGIVKLADLGLARALISEPDPECSGKGTCLGTPEFMAPEQAENAAAVDARSDIYSLGATLYHLLTGELPVKGGSYLHKLQHLLTVPARPLAEARADVPPELAAAVDRMRARSPADRPASAEEVLTLLDPYARDTRKQDPKQWDGRHKAALILEVLRGRCSVAEACERNGLEVAEFEKWRQCFLEGGTKALDPPAAAAAAAVPDEAFRDLYAKIGAQAMELEILRSRGRI